MCPLGPGQQRPSRSSRNQRNRSADVDCLKEYTEHHVDEWRPTEEGEANKLDSSKWIPLSKNEKRLRSSSRSHSGVPIRNYGTDPEHESLQIDSTRWLPVINRKFCIKNVLPTSNKEIDDVKYVKSPGDRSLNNGSTSSMRDNYLRKRRNIEFGYYARESSDLPNWVKSEISTSIYIPSPSARKYTEEGTSKPMSNNKWMTLTKYPSPCPIIRRNTERRPSTNEMNWSDSSKENMESFSKNKYKTVQASKVPSIDCVRLSQRIQELYDIKTECPKRINNSSRENSWIIKSSSREEQPGRRNSQKLEYNGRLSKFYQSVRKREVEPRKSTDSSFDDDWDERLRKFHERLRFSEDLSIDQKVRARDGRTYSDDYEETRRRHSNEENFVMDIKRISDVSLRSRVSYAEIDFSDLSKRGSRTSDASYVSMSSLSPKRGSIENKNVSISTYYRKSGKFESQNVPQGKIISRRVSGQSGERRPSTPVSPKGINDPLYFQKSVSQRSRKQNFFAWAKL